MSSSSNVFKIFGVIIAFIIILLVGLIDVLKASYAKKAVIVYLFIIVIELSVSILLVSGIEIISPAMIIERIVRLFVPGKPVQ